MHRIKNGIKEKPKPISMMDKGPVSYRPDIDGLRGIAILSVFFYHLFPQVFVGGFLGVDIFFVISGFLISKIIFTKLESQSFSFVDFYARRIRRIFPALIITCVLCLFYGWLVLFPNEFLHLGKHVERAVLFLSNLTLYKEGGYFDFSSEMKPLLHLWSLAIEEQFYIVWPFLLWVLFKCERKGFFKTSRHKIVLAFVLLVTCVSFSMHMYLYGLIFILRGLVYGKCLLVHSELITCYSCRK